MLPEMTWREIDSCACRSTSTPLVCLLSPGDTTPHPNHEPVGAQLPAAMIGLILVSHYYPSELGGFG